MEYSNMKKILIIHTFGIGDLIMFTPALEMILNEYKEAQIDIFTTHKETIKPIEHCKRINKIYFSDMNIMSLLKKIKYFRKIKYDISIVTSGGNPWKASIFSKVVNAKRRIGEYRKNKSILYTDNIKYEEKIHRVKNNFKLIENIVSNREYPARSTFFIDNGSYSFVEKYLEKNKLKNKILFGVHPGSGLKQRYKRWKKEYFNDVINGLNERFKNIKILLFIGPDDEEEGRYISSKSDVILIKGFDLYKVAAFISQCKYFLSSDSGLGHIAACFNTRIFTIIGPSKDYKTSPYSPYIHNIKLGMECQPCHDNIKKLSCNQECLKNLKPNTVLDIIRVWLL